MFGFGKEEDRRHALLAKKMEAMGNIFAALATTVTKPPIHLGNHILHVSYIHSIEKIEKGTSIKYFNFSFNQYNSDCFMTIFIPDTEMSFEEIQQKITSFEESNHS